LSAPTELCSEAPILANEFASSTSAGDGITNCHTPNINNRNFKQSTIRDAFSADDNRYVAMA